MLLTDLKEKLQVSSHPARFFREQPNNGVQCTLCPRLCKISQGRSGFCKVRWNEDGRLVTINYGASVQMTQEVIETEAVLHHSPGAPILSLGNIGCMMNCDYCHNWNTSQIMHVKKQDVYHYTPEEVVKTALEKKIKILSWTYNDPVVWQEFVVDTARIAKHNGLLNLYKSAFYIGPEAVDELHEVIDIFSLSLKSMDPGYYRRLTKGNLEPVLKAIKQVYDYKDRHLEISNLVVTGANDKLSEVEKIADWILTELDEKVPVHFVRFHPDYKYTRVGRTSIEFLKLARKRAMEMGLKHVYLGNVFERGEGLNTNCQCGNCLVERFGLEAIPVGLSDAGLCVQCERPTGISMLGIPGKKGEYVNNDSYSETLSHRWYGDINSGHLEARNSSRDTISLRIKHLSPENHLQQTLEVSLRPGESWRFLIFRHGKESQGFEVQHPQKLRVLFYEVLDRAHYPVKDPKPYSSQSL